MIDNENLTITGDKVILVPYRKEHVPVYHDWMLDETLQELTASEPLSMEEEIEMQASWRLDSQKCTFIILDRDRPDTPGTGKHGGGMAGDVNLYWNDHDNPNIAEIEVMIAEEASRRKGEALEALELLMAYAMSQLRVTGFVAKIGFDNVPSQKLFAKLGYVETKRVEVFRELHMTFDAECTERRKSTAIGKALLFGTYDPDSAT